MRLPIDIAAPAPAGRGAWAAALVAALLMFLQVTWNNDFPADFHPDEPGKVRQILEGEYNYHHPLLMLRAAELAVQWQDAGDDPKRIVLAGRQVSALAASAAVLCLVLVAGALGGNFAALAAAALLVTNHSLFELAHYFKEDTALLFGVSLFFLALVHHRRAPGPARALLLGIVLGVAVSAKYTALILVPAALLAILVPGKGGARARQVVIALLASAVVVLVINWPALPQLATFSDSFVRELDRAAGGHDGVGRSVPHTYYVWLAWTYASPVVWLLIAAYLAMLPLRWRSLGLAEAMIAAFPFAFGLLLSFFTQVSFRYYLPGTAVLLVLAGLGAAGLGRLRWAARPLFHPVPSWQVTAAAVAVALMVQAPTLAAYHEGFARDTRSQLARYLREHVPEGTPIAQDNDVALEAFDLPYPLHGARYLSDLGGLDELQALGVEYAAVSRRRFGRLFLATAVAADNAESGLDRRRRFYERLFSEGQLVFEAAQGPVKYLQPHLALYRLPGRPPAAPGAREPVRAEHGAVPPAQ
jgi:hypothetical protein